MHRDATTHNCKVARASAANPDSSRALGVTAECSAECFSNFLATEGRMLTNFLSFLNIEMEDRSPDDPRLSENFASNVHPDAEVLELCGTRARSGSRAKTLAVAGSFSSVL